jgi:tRNA A-37 threonylcarbamoyl transferase component Bud32
MADPPDAAGEPRVRRLLAAGPAEIAALPGARTVKENPVRTVWRVPGEGGAVYLKRFRVSGLRDAVKYLFVPSRARAEWEASRGLRAAGIPAAEVLGFAETRAGGFLRGAACVVREFPAAMELVPWMFARWGRGGPWTPEQEAERHALLGELGRLLRSIHDAGFRHPDLHGGNLLLAKEGFLPEMRVIDLHTVKRGSPRRAGDLLVLVHSLRTATSPEEREVLRRAYDGDRPALPPAGRARWEALVEEKERVRVRGRTARAKLLGPTGRFAVHGGGGLRMVHLRAWGAAPFLAALEEHRRLGAAGEGPGVLKRGGRSLVTRVRVEGPDGPTRLVVKETRVRDLLDAVKNAFRPPRAVAGWIGGNGLWHRHVDVAEPRAVAVRGAWPRRRESFLVMEDLAEGGERLDLRSLRLWGRGTRGAEAVRAKRAEIALVAALLGDLHARGVYHGDLKAVNLFHHEKHGRPSIGLVDYDRVEFGGGVVPFRRRAKNLAQLGASLGDYFSRSDRLRFFREYAARVPGAWEERRRTADAVAAASARKIVVRREPIE